MTDWSTLKKLIWLRIIKGGGGIERTVKGAIVHVINALARPAISVKCEVNPIQDLHGYDSPWPAGGGVSKCPSFANGTHTMTNGLTVTIQDGEITINGTASDSGYYEEAIESTVMPADAYVSFNNPVGTYNIAYVFINGNTQIASPSTAPANATKQPTGLSGATVDKLRIFCNAATYDNFKMSPIVHDGSTPQAWQPYSNICPISGRTSATVTRTGKNLNPNLGNQFTTNNSIKFYLKAGTYTVSTSDGTAFDTNNAVYFHLLDGDNNTITKGNMQSDRLTLNSSETFYYGGQHFNSITFALLVDAYMLFGFNNQLPAETYSLQLELGSTASDYEPYTGTTYTIQFGDTVYGGTLDVTGGKMVVDRAMVDVTTGSDNGVRNGLQQLAYSFPGKKPGLDNFISNVFSIGIGAYEMIGRAATATVEFRVPLSVLGVTEEDSGTVRVNAFKAWLTDHSTQLCYELATPIEITLTPTQIDMLLGENNLWADAGDLTLTYYADGNASTSEALGILLGGTYNNPGGADDVSDDEALGILLGGS